MMLKKTHKQARKAVKKGIKVSLTFNSSKGDTLIILCHDFKTRKLLNSLAVEAKNQTDELLAKAIKKLVKGCKKWQYQHKKNQCNSVVNGTLALLLAVAVTDEFIELINKRNKKGKK